MQSAAPPGPFCQLLASHSLKPLGARFSSRRTVPFRFAVVSLFRLFRSGSGLHAGPARPGRSPGSGSEPPVLSFPFPEPFPARSLELLLSLILFDRSFGFG